MYRHSQTTSHNNLSKRAGIQQALAGGSTAHLFWNLSALALCNNKVKKGTILLSQNKQNLKYALLKAKNHWELNWTKVSALIVWPPNYTASPNHSSNIKLHHSAEAANVQSKTNRQSMKNELLKQ